MSNYAPNLYVGKAISVTDPTAAGATVTAGAAGVKGNYAELDDGSGMPSAAFRIVGICIDTPSAAFVGSIDIATGALGVEVDIASISLEVATDAGGYPPIYIPPSGSIAASTRITARMVTVAGGHTIGVKVMYQEV